MPRTIRFHLDEHCPHAIAEGLRRADIDVTTTTEAGLLRAPDERHIALRDWRTASFSRRMMIFSFSMPEEMVGKVEYI